MLVLQERFASEHMQGGQCRRQHRPVLLEAPTATRARASQTNPGEQEPGSSPGAVRLPSARLFDGRRELDPAVPTVVYCASGYRSSIAASLLRALGFSWVADLQGGFGAGASAELPVSALHAAARAPRLATGLPRRRLAQRARRGGSILAVPALVYGAGQNPREATAASLLIAGGAVIGLGPHLRAGRVRVATGVAFGAAGIPGSLLGTTVNHRIKPDLLLLGFAGLVLVAAWRMLTGCPTCTRIGEDRTVRGRDGEPRGGARVAVRSRIDARRAAAVVAAGSGVGSLTGLFGVGGGFVIVPSLTLLLISRCRRPWEPLWS